jgi:hypothetical protein
MNVKLGYTMHFTAGVWWDNHLIMSNYTATFKLITVTPDVRDSNVALERLRYLLSEVLTDAVFVNQIETDQIKKLKAAGIETILMPEEPVDQIVGMMLYSKANAIMEGRVAVRSVLLSSNVGDEVIYEHDLNESLAPFDKTGWWNNSTPYCENTTGKKSKDQVFLIASQKPWRDLDLDWFDLQVESDEENVLVFTDFKNDKDK